MSFFLFILLAIIILGVTLVISFIKGVSSFIFGKPGSSSARQGYDGRYQSSSNNYYEEDKAKHKSHKTHRKVFSKDEGEYVNYEEIKE